MIDVSILEKSSNKIVFSFKAKTVRLHKDYSDPSIYVAYHVEENKYAEGYSWNGSEVVYDENYTPPTEPIEVTSTNAVKNAIKFGSDLMTEFAAENVAMGITQAGLTADVLAVMENRIEVDSVNKPGVYISVMGTINSGSLYESINVINHHINKANNGDYSHLSPYITSSRLESFRDRIVSYLT